MADVTKSTGGLVMMFTREESGIYIELHCATHYKLWKVGAHVRADVIALHENDLAHWSNVLVFEARRRFDTCRCASPLFDDDFTDVDGVPQAK